jgi:hypothetical protein
MHGVLVGFVMRERLALARSKYKQPEILHLVHMD